MTDNYWKLA